MRSSGYVNGDSHIPGHDCNYFKDVLKQSDARVEVVMVRIPEVGSADVLPSVYGS